MHTDAREMTKTSMTKMMRSAVVRSFREPLRIEEVPVPQPGRGQVLIKVEASGVCHTDLHAAKGDWPVRPKPPFIPGHEGAGIVTALGPDVSDLKIGDRVGVPWLHSACGRCDHCIGGWETLCGKQQNSGYSVNGAFAEYVAASADYVAKIPDELDFVTVAPILCAGVTTYKALKETEARPGQWVMISGIGGLGHVAVQYARAMGLHVAAIDISDEKLDLAKKLGAELTINARAEDAAAKIQRELGGVHGAVITAVSPPAFRQGIATLRRGGTCSLVGLPPGDFSLPIFDVVLNRYTIRGSIVGTRLDLKEALELARDAKIKPTIEKRPLEDINEVFESLERGRVEGRVVLTF
jgi:alcohol dehydrogenase, propanol-preferring